MLNEQPLFVQHGCQTGLTTVLYEQLFVQPVVKPGCTTGLTTVLNEQPLVECLYTRYNRLSNRFDNRLYRVYKHLPGCQTGLTSGLTTGCIV